MASLAHLLDDWSREIRNEKPNSAYQQHHPDGEEPALGEPGVRLRGDRVAGQHPLRELGDHDLSDRLAETSEELFNLRFQNVTGQLDNYSRLSEVKRDKARVLTELRAGNLLA